MDTDEITAKEAAKVLDVSERHVRWYFTNGHLPGRRVGERVLVFKRADVEKLALNKPKAGRPPKPPAAKPKRAKPAPSTKPAAKRKKGGV